MLSPLLIVKHVFHVSIMIFIIHELKSLLLDLDCSLLLSSLDLSRVQEFFGIFDSLFWQQADGNHVLVKPCVYSFQVLLLELRFICQNNLTQHFLQTLMHLNHVSEIDTSSEFLFNMFLSWSKLPILGCLEMKLNKFILKPDKHLVIAERIGGE